MKDAHLSGVRIGKCIDKPLELAVQLPIRGSARERLDTASKFAILDLEVDHDGI
jgi:hypothetical protein